MRQGVQKVRKVQKVANRAKIAEKCKKCSKVQKVAKSAKSVEKCKKCESWEIHQNFTKWIMNSQGRVKIMISCEILCKITKSWILKKTLTFLKMSEKIRKGLKKLENVEGVLEPLKISWYDVLPQPGLPEGVLTFS